MNTLLINLTGCFGMGLLATLSLGQVIVIHPDVRWLLLTGFLMMVAGGIVVRDPVKVVHHAPAE